MGAHRAIYRDATVLLAFAAIVVLMTYPQALRLATATRDGGDPLFSAWAMWWEAHAVRAGNIAGFFNTNIFFPHLHTLAYSEFMVPQALLGAPLSLLFDNPIIPYNVVLLLSLLTTAFAMYLLCRHLTGSAFGGFVGGLSLAFSPYMFSHLSHLQVIGAAGIPLTFLFLRRYLDDGSVRDLLCFTGAYVAQALGNVHYGVYLTYAAGAYILYRMWRDRRFRDARLHAHLAGHILLSLAVLWPFYRQYLVLRQQLGFAREAQYGAAWYHFFAAPPINRVYGELTAGWYGDERALFPGLAVLALAAFGLWTSQRRTGGRPAEPRSGGHVPAAARASPGTRAAYALLGVVIVAELLVVLAVVVTGGITTSVAGIPLRANRIGKPLAGLLIAIIVRGLMRRRHPGLGDGVPLQQREPLHFFGGLLFASVVLTLGSNGPYRLLYDYLPGFNGIRATPRIHIMTLFCVALFAAYGAREVARAAAHHGHARAAALVPIVILAECFSAPLPLHEVRWGSGVPAAYRWLARQEGDFAVLELPMDEDLEFDRMLYSTLHRKQLVNGTSGYPSPTYTELKRRSGGLPSRALANDARALGVRWVIVHRELYGADRGAIDDRLTTLSDLLEPVAEFGPTVVLEERGGPWLTRPEVLEGLVPAPEPGARLSRDGWSADAGVNGNLAGLAIDGIAATRWYSGPQRPGSHFSVDLGKPVRFDTIRTTVHPFPHDYPHGWRLEVSDDGIQWSPIAREPAAAPPITDFIDPRSHPFEITFPEVQSRYLRIVQTGVDEQHVWSIYELELYRHLPAER